MFTIPLSSPLANLENSGGKGANLARLLGFDFPVPGGFIVVTTAYRAFVEHNGLGSVIAPLIANLAAEQLAELETASTQIRAAFRAGSLPVEIAEAICQAYIEMGAGSVAVRSSATAEDLPGMSFAGQQDTFLNIQGEQALLSAVVDCWASLWTARAIGYRMRNAIPQDQVSLAVVVQRMVPSAASGVLFTANPLTGLRSETVIDATLGLGDALVSGQVDPDHYIVDVEKGVILRKRIGAKIASGPSHAAPSEIQALPDEHILELASLGRQVAARFGEPQDIEWAFAAGQLYLVQSRPITTLFPVPTEFTASDLHVMFSFGAVQGVLGPFTPLGQDAIRLAFTDFAHWLGFHYTYDTQPVLRRAGERLWVEITPIVKNSVGRRIIPVALNFVEPSAGQALQQIWDDPRLQPARAGMRFSTLLRLARFFVPMVGRVIRNIIAPDQRRTAILGKTERVLSAASAKVITTGSGREKLRHSIDFIESDAVEMFGLAPELMSLVVSSMFCLNLVNRLARRLNPTEAAQSGVANQVLELTRGLPYNPTTEMDLNVWGVASQIGADLASRQDFSRRTVSELVNAYRTGSLPTSVHAALQPFLDRYGMRGLGEIDLGRPRWREDPTPLFQTLASYLEITDPELSPSAVFERSARSAEQALDALVAALRASPGGWIKAPAAHWAGKRMRALLGQRESPKFFIIRSMDLFRKSFLDAGCSLVQEGVIDSADDLFFLDLAELKELASGKTSDWRARIMENREKDRREQLRRQVPRVLLSDGRAFYAGLASSNRQENMLNGSPVSPGMVEGLVHVVLDPRGARLTPGEILVCPGTDPSWTPLFLTAGGLVMEVGGMMTHGAVVAREYGIPAVVGVDEATRRLHTGQRVRVDGSTGIIELL
ncbi:MAG TPA: PEP/pyruvate-binding domain-containing protein [Anaerolineaceae bacterium]|nr:PEP/pyruvate-binding domain-containing protein [Anaerolineaceae bacterium]